jgi:hypothetical protein
MGMDAGYANLIDDGHRHSYMLPPYQRVERIAAQWGKSEVMVAREWERVDPKLRICRYCGWSKVAVRRWQRANPPSAREATPLRPSGYKHSAKEMAWAEAEWIKLKKPSGLNNFTTIVYDRVNDEYLSKKVTQGYCYARVAGSTAEGKHRPVYFVDKAGSGRDWKVNKQYVEWLYYDSPYSPSLVNTPEHYYDTRCTIQKLEYHPSQFIIQAAMAFRYQYEYSHFVDKWQKLVDLGMDRNVAFVLCQSGTLGGGKYNFSGMTAHGHSIFDKGLWRNGLGNFLNGTWGLVGYKQERRYMGEDTGIVTNSSKRELVPASKNMYYLGLVTTWQQKKHEDDKAVTCDPVNPGQVLDVLGRPMTSTIHPCRTTEQALELQRVFLEQNGVDYVPESIHRERRSPVCEDVPVSRVEGVEA